MRRMWAFLAALPPRGPHPVQLAALLARISTDDQFQFGIRAFLAGLNASNRNASTWPHPSHRRMSLLSPLDRVGVDAPVPTLRADVVGS